MCEPVTMTVLSAGIAGGTSLLGGATAAGAIGSAALAGASTYMSMSGVEQTRRSGYYAATGDFISAGEMQKRIQQIEDQAAIEELQRRDAYEYLTAKNAAAATMTGVRFDSETFQAIRDRNERVYRLDEEVASLNEANAKGQAAGQGIQHSMSGFARIIEAEEAATQQTVQMGIDLFNNFPSGGFGKIGGGITNPSKQLMAQVQTAVRT